MYSFVWLLNRYGSAIGLLALLPSTPTTIVAAATTQFQGKGGSVTGQLNEEARVLAEILKSVSHLKMSSNIQPTLRIVLLQLLSAFTEAGVQQQNVTNKFVNSSLFLSGNSF
jgi:hypothetical protein